MSSSVRPISPPPSYPHHFFDLAPTPREAEAAQASGYCIVAIAPSADGNRPAASLAATGPSALSSPAAYAPAAEPARIPAHPPRNAAGSRRRRCGGLALALVMGGVIAGVKIGLRGHSEAGAEATGSEQTVTQALGMALPSTARSTASAVVGSASPTRSMGAAAAQATSVGSLQLGAYAITASKLADSCQSTLVACADQRRDLWLFAANGSQTTLSFPAISLSVAVGPFGPGGGLTVLLPTLPGVSKSSNCSLATTIRLDLTLQTTTLTGEAAYDYRNEGTGCASGAAPHNTAVGAACQCTFAVAGTRGQA